MGLDKTPRPDLKDECEKLLISKKGCAQTLKETIVRKRMSKMNTEELEAYLPLQGKPTAALPPPQETPETQPSEPPPASAAPAAPPADGQAGDETGAGKGEVVMFGRKTFAVEVDEENDKTGFWDDMGDQDWETKEPDKMGYLELAEAGTSGIIPVAALIKVMQGFQEEGNNHLAFLLAGKGESVCVWDVIGLVGTCDEH